MKLKADLSAARGFLNSTLNLKRSFLKLFLCASLVFIGACSTHYENLNLKPFTQKSFELKSGQKSEILYLSSSDKGYHFALFDAFGAPLASKVFDKKEFRNDKFLPSKSAYEPLFYEILRMIEKGQRKMEYKEFKVREL